MKKTLVKISGLTAIIALALFSFGCSSKAIKEKNPEEEAIPTVAENSEDTGSSGG